MLLHELHIANIKCFPEAHLTFPSTTTGGNWCVLLGENGTGKTTLLQAIALSVLSRTSWARILDHPEKWVRQDAPGGQCTATFVERARNEAGTHKVMFDLRSLVSNASDASADEEPVVYRGRSFPQLLRLVHPDHRTFVVAGYGAFRRMEGSLSPADEKFRRSRPITAAFSSLFHDEVGLPGLADWLLRLDYLSKDAVATSAPRERQGLKRRLQSIVEVVNSLLPEDRPFELKGVSANGLFFATPAGDEISLEAMSDGYRTMFALAVDLLRQIHVQNPDPKTQIFGADERGRAFVDVPGIVVIDEVDAHLHPRWQQEIGSYLQRSFPRIQFIVASHSPFVAQSASEGGLFALRRLPGSNSVSVEPLQSVQGLTAEEILLSPAFGFETTRDLETDALLEEHTRLLALKNHGKTSQAQDTRLEELSRRLEPVLHLQQAYSREVLDRILRRPTP